MTTGTADPGSDLDLGKAAGAMPDPAAAITHASEVLAAAPPREPLAYPSLGLGPTLCAACHEIADKGQAQRPLVGQALLAAAALLTQGLFNAETLVGPSPLSLYFITAVNSGDGKSIIFKTANKRIQDRQCREAAHFEYEKRAFEEAQRATRGKNGKSTSASDEAAAAPTVQPTPPFRIVADVTVEGLRRDLRDGLCSQGVFTDEAVTILAGHGMNIEHRAKTAGTYAKLWDGGHLSTSRASEGRIERTGLRLSMHWLIQPSAAADPINDELLSSLGFWPRFMAAQPEPMKPRKAIHFCPEQLPAVRAYWLRCNELLDQPLPDNADASPVLALSSAAREMLCAAFEQYEVEGRTGELKSIKPFALRATEQACRVAGVIAAFEGESEVSSTTMDGALALVNYSLTTWLNLIDDDTDEQSTAAALRLFEWLTTRENWCEDLAVILRYGPGATKYGLRTKEGRDAALAVLQRKGLVHVFAADKTGRVCAAITYGS